MNRSFLFIILSSIVLFASGTIEGAIEKRDLNMPAIIMFLLFVGATLGITYWAAKRTKSPKDFYTAGGGITGFQNGMAIAGDYMSAASFLGISGLVYMKGYDGLIYSIGFLVGWPIILFMIAEPLRNLGKYSFAALQAEFTVLYKDGSLAVDDPTVKKVIKLQLPDENRRWVDEFNKNSIFFDLDDKGNVKAMNIDSVSKFSR